MRGLLPVREPLISAENLEYCEEDGSYLFTEVSFRLEWGQRGVLLAEPHRCANILLKICATLLEPTNGSISWFGGNAEEPGEKWLYHVRRRIGFVHRETSLISNMTIMDNVSLGIQYHEELSREQAYDRVTETLKRFELFDYRFLRPAELTFEQRRLAVYARELTKKPQLFLLEHPSLDLGERVYSFLIEVFKTCSMEDGCGFLVASMIPEVVNRWGDWVMVFDQGRCRHFEVDQFDPSIYRESMRRRGATLSKEWRNG
jgi:ABC-type sulfate/molybdate transport systems ATPase subunit